LKLPSIWLHAAFTSTAPDWVYWQVTAYSVVPSKMKTSVLPTDVPSGRIVAAGCAGSSDQPGS
jgi:hypothetical protein